MVDKQNKCMKRFESETESFIKDNTSDMNTLQGYIELLSATANDLQECPLNIGTIGISHIHNIDNYVTFV